MSMQGLMANYTKLGLETAYMHVPIIATLLIWTLLTLSACARVTVVICLSVCVSLSTLEASLIYSAKNWHQWTANGILFIKNPLKSCKSAPSIWKQQSMLAVPLAALATHTKVQSSFQSISSDGQIKLSQSQRQM